MQPIERPAKIVRSLLLLLTAVFILLSGEAVQPQEEENRRQALLLTVNGAIGPATMDYVVRGIRRAENENAGLVILQMDTPGGLMEAMRGIIREMLNSQVPVATYVGPSGARAASAGTYILYGSHIAAMAPATHLGSATPVQMGGLPGSPDEQQDSSPGNDSDKAPAEGDKPRQDGDGQKTEKPGGGSAMERKVIEDAVTYIRELAERHGRNADWAEKAVREAVNLGAAAALEQKVIDVVAVDVEDLLVKIDGRRVVMDHGELTLSTADLRLERVDPNWRTRLLSIITDPNIAYFLMILGFYGLIFELANPGGMVAGVIGAICLILALFAFQVLSVNYAGLALIILGLAFIVGEAFLPSFGILGIGGIIAFIVGSIILMDGSEMRVSLTMVGGTAALAAAFMLWTVTRFISLRKRHAASGIEQTAHEQAVALDDFKLENGIHKGNVWLSGERWRAVSQQPVGKGTRLRVMRVEGLTAHVAPGEPEGSEP